MVRQPTPDELCDASGRVSELLRHEFPAEYVKVDRHLSRVGRKQSYVTHEGDFMAMDQLEQYRQDAEALDRAGNIAAFFAGLSGDNEADAEQARDDENCLRRYAKLLHELAEG